MDSTRDLYETDLDQWATLQASRLREVARLSNADVDWDHLFEELEGLSRSERRAVENAIVGLLVHLLKIIAWPESGAVNHWFGEAASHLNNARRIYRASMRQYIEPTYADAYRDALRVVQAIRTIDGRDPLPVPERSPVAFDDLVANDGADVRTLVEFFRGT